MCAIQIGVKVPVRLSASAFGDLVILSFCTKIMIRRTSDVLPAPADAILSRKARARMGGIKQAEARPSGRLNQPHGESSSLSLA
jgi:hypothetical protein